MIAFSIVCASWKYSGTGLDLSSSTASGAPTDNSDPRARGDVAVADLSGSVCEH